MSVTLIVDSLFLAVSLPICIYDLRERRIPDLLSVGGTGVILLLSVLLEPASIPSRIGGTALGAGTIWVINRATGGKIGLGDAKYSGLIGATLGIWGWFWALLSASILGLAVFAFLFAIRRIELNTRIPFGPFLACGALVAIFAGSDLTRFITAGT